MAIFFFFFSEVIQFLNIADETIKTGLAFYQCLLFSLYISWFLGFLFVFFFAYLTHSPVSVYLSVRPAISNPLRFLMADIAVSWSLNSQKPYPSDNRSNDTINNNLTTRHNKITIKCISIKQSKKKRIVNINSI